MTGRRPDSAEPADPLAELVRRARAAQARAYAPYSGYPVGAAVQTADGRCFDGVNVENAAYGATVCAERVAVWTAVAAGERQLVALALVTPTGAAPCGACRQVLAEFGGPALPVAMAGPEGPYRVLTLGQLLPEAFRLDMAAGGAPP